MVFQTVVAEKDLMSGRMHEPVVWKLDPVETCCDCGFLGDLGAGCRKQETQTKSK
jgi:hypothetical protein